MTVPDNILGDFPAQAFTIFVWCEACGHKRTVDRTKVPDSVPMRTLHARLRCSACGVRETSIRIVYTGAGGFRCGETILDADGNPTEGSCADQP